MYENAFLSASLSLSRQTFPPGISGFCGCSVASVSLMNSYQMEVAADFFQLSLLARVRDAAAAAAGTTSASETGATGVKRGIGKKTTTLQQEMWECCMNK